MNKEFKLEQNNSVTAIRIEARIDYYYPYRAFGGQNKIVHSTRFVTRRQIILLLPGLCDKEGNNIIIAWAKQTKWKPAVTHDRKIVR